MLQRPGIQSDLSTLTSLLSYNILMKNVQYLHLFEVWVCHLGSCIGNVATYKMKAVLFGYCFCFFITLIYSIFLDFKLRYCECFPPVCILRKFRPYLWMPHTVNWVLLFIESTQAFFSCISMRVALILVKSACMESKHNHADVLCLRHREIIDSVLHFLFLTKRNAQR